MWLSYGTSDWKVVFNTRQDQNSLLVSKAARTTLDTRVSFDRATEVWGWLLTSTKGRGEEYVGAIQPFLPHIHCMMHLRCSTLLFSANREHLKEILIVYTRGRWSNFNPLTPNDPYRGRTSPLISKRCILYVYSTNTGTEYFKNGIFLRFFSSKCSLFHNSNVFGSCNIHILYTGCAKIKKKSGAKRLIGTLD